MKPELEDIIDRVNEIVSWLEGDDATGWLAVRHRVAEALGLIARGLAVLGTGADRAI